MSAVDQEEKYSSDYITPTFSLDSFPAPSPDPYSNAILAWNCQSLYGKLSELSSFLTLHLPLVIALSETWPAFWSNKKKQHHSSPTDVVKIPGYYFVNASEQCLTINSSSSSPSSSTLLLSLLVHFPSTYSLWRLRLLCERRHLLHPSPSVHHL